MSSQNRTFVLQAVGVAVVVGVIFFAFLRPSDVGELSGIDAPGDDGSTFGIPGDGREGGKDARSQAGSDERGSNPTRSVLASAPASNGGLGPPPAADDPAGDQYTSTAIALMNRVRAPVEP
jgi:hypothetical protein